jgi:hypothetical protein
MGLECPEAAGRGDPPADPEFTLCKQYTHKGAVPVKGNFNNRIFTGTAYNPLFIRLRFSTVGSALRKSRSKRSHFCL